MNNEGTYGSPTPNQIEAISRAPQIAIVFGLTAVVLAFLSRSSLQEIAFPAVFGAICGFWGIRCMREYVRYGALKWRDKSLFVIYFVVSIEFPMKEKNDEALMGGFLLSLLVYHSILIFAAATVVTARRELIFYEPGWDS